MKTQLRMFRIIGFDNDLFFEQTAAISARIAFDCDGSLTTGRDLFRIGNSRAPSAGSHFLNL
jgi:hypothetical protein